MSTVHLFSQVASLIDRTIVVSAAKKRHTDKYCQTLDTWTHLIALLFCHMADCQSLRDICKGLQGIRGGLNHLGIQKAPSRNALSHQNAKRDAMVFRDIYQLLHKRLGQQAFTCRFREGIKASRIILLDSSVITLLQVVATFCQGAFEINGAAGGIIRWQGKIEQAGNSIVQGCAVSEVVFKMLCEKCKGPLGGTDA